VITLGCVQSSYIPWRGYFDIIRRSDVFVFHDDIQYTKQDWRNRNRIKTPSGPAWLTVPVKKDSIGGAIDEVVVDDDQDWRKTHWRRIEGNYRLAPYFKEVAPVLREAFQCEEKSLSAMNIRLIRLICGMIGINTPLVSSRGLRLEGRKTERLILMCKAVGATRYLSGPSGSNYLEADVFEANGIELAYMEYRYPEYPQQFAGFRGDLSIVDLLLNCGTDCLAYMDASSPDGTK
jgi:hypothetical protein